MTDSLHSTHSIQSDMNSDDSPKSKNDALSIKSKDFEFDFLEYESDSQDNTPNPPSSSNNNHLPSTTTNAVPLDSDDDTDLHLNVNALSSTNGTSNAVIPQHQQAHIDPTAATDLVEDIPTQKGIRCAYCGIPNIKCLIKCNDCNRWFCNGKLDSFSASHIVFHLTKSKHKEIYVSKESQVGEMVMECYYCQCKNIFLLGILETKEGDSGVLICREPCLTTCKIEDNKYDKTKWAPLITDKKRIIEWIVPEPSTEIEKRICQRVNIRNMSKLEDKWEKDKLLASQEKPKFLGNYLKPVKLSYEDGQDYLETFEPLISAEEEYDRKLKETQKKTDIKTKFVKSGRKIIAKFTYPREDNEIKLVAGDELKITDPTNNKSYRGFVIEIELDDEVHLELEKCDKLLNDGMFTIEFVWKGTSFKRMLDGLYTFVNTENSVSNYIYSKLLGHEVVKKKFNYQIPKDLSVKGLPELNAYQTLGIKRALTTPLFLIQGPPGTGKTVTSAAIVYHLAKLKAGNKVLVCAPSNIAADQLSEKVEKIGLKVVRVCAKSRESISSRVEHLSLHNQLRKLNPKEYKRLFELLKKKEEDGIDLTKSEHDQYKKLKSKAEAVILDDSEVVVTTCIASFDKRLNNYRFPIVLIDEATQACESECILPLLRGAKHAILVGDHCQLGPVVLCKSAAKAGLKMSLFERLVKLKIKPHMLQVQYRMHPKLSEFPSNTFYHGNLQNGVSAEERTYYSVPFPWPTANNPTFFYHIVGKEEFSASGTSYLNRSEADFIEKVVTHFLRCSVKPDQIGIITPYEGQRCYLVSHMLKNGSVNTNLYKEIEVASVDSFQGREKDFIILSCVRSNEHHGIGFLDDPRRLNVALTRARYGLVIVGNAIGLSKHQLWINLLHHYKSTNLLVEGSLNNFKEMIISVPPPKRYIPEKMVFESQMNLNTNVNTTLTENTSMEISYGDNAFNNSNKQYADIFNNATVSRFSDFGYTNDQEAASHFNKVKCSLRSHPLQISNELGMNKFEQRLQQLNALQMQQMFGFPPVMGMQQVVQGFPGAFGFGMPFMNMNMNMNMNMQQMMLGQNMMRFGEGMNKGMMMGRFNGAMYEMNTKRVLEQEKKFVIETEF